MAHANNQLTALVAEDEPAMLNLVARHLKGLGFHVVEASEGDIAWELAQTHHPDIVILDVMMPGMSGLDAARALRQDSAMDGLPIIMLTARAQESDIEQGFEAGADDYIVKPFSPRELASRVSAVLARTR